MQYKQSTEKTKKPPMDLASMEESQATEPTSEIKTAPPSDTSTTESLTKAFRERLALRRAEREAKEKAADPTKIDDQKLMGAMLEIAAIMGDTAFIEKNSGLKTSESVLRQGSQPLEFSPDFVPETDKKDLQFLGIEQVSENMNKTQQKNNLTPGYGMRLRAERLAKETPEETAERKRKARAIFDAVIQGMAETNRENNPTEE